MLLSLQGAFLLGIGALIGSFGNVLILRLPKGEGVMGGRSHCPQCRKDIAFYDLIPILSYLLLLGRCRHCRTRISLQYPLVESFTAGLFFITQWYRPVLPSLWMHVLLGFCLWLLFVISVIDARTQLIPDVLNLALLAFAAVFALLTHGVHWISLAVALGFFGVQWVASRGQAIGSGDLFLAATMALLLGSWPKLLVGLMFSYVIGTCVVLVLLALKRKRFGETIAFGPFMALGIMAALFYGDRILWQMLGV